MKTSAQRLSLTCHLHSTRCNVAVWFVVSSSALITLFLSIQWNGKEGPPPVFFFFFFNAPAYADALYETFFVITHNVSLRDFSLSRILLASLAHSWTSFLFFFFFCRAVSCQVLCKRRKKQIDFRFSRVKENEIHFKSCPLKKKRKKEKENVFHVVNTSHTHEWMCIRLVCCRALY